jgi:hypothetical protein
LQSIKFLPELEVQVAMFCFDRKATSIANIWKRIKEILQKREEIENTSTNYLCGCWVKTVGVLHHTVCPAHT